MKVETKVKIILEDGMEINLEEQEARKLYHELKKMFGYTDVTFPFYPFGYRPVEINRGIGTGDPMIKPYVTWTSGDTLPLVDRSIQTTFMECETIPTMCTAP